MDELTDEQAQAAKDRLEVAIRDYIAAVEPEVLVTAWVLITHKVSADMDAEGISSVGSLVPTGQAWPMTLGILDAALIRERASIAYE